MTATFAHPILAAADLPPDLQPAIEASIDIACQTLGERLLAIYALGSLGYQGYVPGWSDADLDLIVADDGQSAEALLEQGFAIRSAIHAAGFPMVDIKCYSTEIINAGPASYEYGSANRAVMLLDSARLIYGDDLRHAIRRPAPMDLCREALQVAGGLVGKGDTWWESRPIDDTAALFALPGRLLITCQTGQVVNKTPALHYLLSQYGAAVPAQAWPWIVWALACRHLAPPRAIAGQPLLMAQHAARDLLAWAIPLIEAHAASLEHGDD